MPPTRRLTVAIPANRSVNTLVVSAKVLRKSDWLRIWKSSGWPGRSRCSRRRMRCTSAIVWGICASVGASTLIARRRSEPITRKRAVLIGMRIWSSGLFQLCACPLDSSTPMTSNWMPRMRIVSPTIACGLWSPRFSTTAGPTTATRRRARSSALVNIVPAWSLNLRTVR